MGRSKLIIKTRCKYSHFTWDERLILQYHYQGANKYEKITSPTVLGVLLSKHERTIRREIKQGLVEHIKSDLTTAIVYDAEFAQNQTDFNSSAKGPSLKVGNDWDLINAISELIKDSKYSPYAIIQHFNQTSWPSETRICEKTIYNYIHAGDISNISENDLMYEGKRFKPKGKPKKHARASNASRSISKRPEGINNRTEAGHWEMDTVYSGKGQSKECLITLTERKTRAEIIRKIPDRTASSVTNEINKMERVLGQKVFSNLFLSITADNGVEFSAAQELETSVLRKGKRTQIFFAHPYCSFERGTNENHNGIIRRFIKKGSNIGDVKKKTVREIQDWMNSYPRKILGGKTPLQALIIEMEKKIKIPRLLEVNL